MSSQVSAVLNRTVPENGSYFYILAEIMIRVKVNSIDDLNIMRH